jgi:non-specific serine/threonine protein kinase
MVLEEALSLFRDFGDERDCAVVLGALADVALAQGDSGRATALLRESLPLGRGVADRRAIAHSATILVEHGPRFGQPERMARLAGALDAWREEMGAIRHATRYARGVAAARSALGEQAFDRARAEGRELTVDQVADEALAVLAAAPAAGAPAAGRRSDGLLSEREREVLRLLADGLTNREIAQALVVTEHTAKFHVASLLNKLGASTRGQAVALAVERDLLDARPTSR